LLFLEFERISLNSLQFSRDFSLNKKSRKPLIHKDFRDFVLEGFLEIFVVCVVRAAIHIGLVFSTQLDIIQFT